MRVLNLVRDAVAFCAVFSGLWLGNAAIGDPITVPTGLSVGDQYRLVFVTSTTHQATSSDINSYNSIVDALGDTVIESDWKVIGSTLTVDAIDNTATPITTSGVSIWRLDDVKVADDYADLWDGTIDAAITLDESAATPGGTDQVVTGTDTDGTAMSGTGPSAGYLGHGAPGLGIMDASSSRWTDGDVGSNADFYRLYSMSGTLTVEASAVPEPSSAILLGLVAGGGLIRSRRKRRQACSAA